MRLTAAILLSPKISARVLEPVDRSRIHSASNKQEEELWSANAARRANRGAESTAFDCSRK